ncbi:hypothetical protein ACOMHN_011955 [Nucella lapillus]
MAGQYEKVKLLGSGSYGKAWLANCRSKKRQVVVKEIKLDGLSDKEIEQALLEVKILAKCRHVNIISYCEAFESACCLHIVMEFAENGDLQRRIVEQRGIHFSNETILDWFIQICFALKYLHSENILHRDLKPQNLFLTSDGTVKVGDFGIARVLQDTGDHALTAIGTPYYLSPEICQRRPYDSKSDMWSAGCVLYELCCLRVPFQAPNLPLLVLAILQGQYDPVPSHCGAVLEDLVSVLLKTDPSRRPTAQQVLKVPALQPHVGLTYRRCLRHKQRRHHHHQSPHMMVVSREVPCSPTRLFSPKQVDKSPRCHRTFSVKSPLVRRLSVATPKLKAAIKRQRSVQSAEPAHTRKRHRQNSIAPVSNLQKAFLGLRPSRPRGPDLSPPPTQCTAGVWRTPPTDAHHHGPGRNRPRWEHSESVSHTPSVDIQKKESDKMSFDSDAGGEGNESSYLDDVFDSIPTEGDASGGSFQVPKHPCHGVDESSQRKPCGFDGQYDSVSSSVSSPAFCKNLFCDKVARSAAPEVRSGYQKENDDELLSAFSRSSCRPVESKQFSADSFDMPKVSVAKKKHDGIMSNPDCYQTPRGQRLFISDTCTVDSQVQTEGRSLCPICGDGRQPQHCLHQALFQATALSYKNKAAAQRCLLQCLITHLGSDLSLRLCSLANLALHSGEEFATLETHLDEECKSYLPVIFHLLTWSEEGTVGK